MSFSGRVGLAVSCLWLLASSLTAAPQEGGAASGSVASQLENMRQKLPFDLHGGAYLWHYEPMLSGTKANTELYFANLTLDASSGDFGFHFEPRFRDSKLRPFFSSNVWVQEIYASWKAPYDIGSVKAGKEYSRFGHFWDDCFYGNIPYFDGLKLDPDLGLSLENTRKIDAKWQVEYALQYFTIDGRTNGSLSERDTIGVTVPDPANGGAATLGAHRRNIVIARAAPKFSISDTMAVTVGASGERFTADFLDIAPVKDETVTRWAVDTQFDAGPFSVFGEYTQQKGSSVINYPVTNAASDDTRYYWAGAGYHWRDVLFRLAYSEADYRDNSIHEWLWLPGVTWNVNDHISLLAEYVAWRQHRPASDATFDRSLNFILYVHF